MSPLFIAKLTLAPSIVASGSVAGRRWGHQVGGLVAGFPNTSSPILLFLAMERGNSFAAEAAVNVLLGLVAMAVYGVVYTWSARRLDWWLSLPLGWTAFLGTAFALRHVQLSAAPAAVLAAGSLALAMLAMPNVELPPALPPRKEWDLPLRMGAAILLLVGITASAGWLGAGLSGILSAFPIASSVLTASAHAEAGAGGAVKVLKGIFTALMALILFTGVLALLLPTWSLLAAFCLSGALGFLAQIALIAWRKDLPSFAA